MDYNNTFQDFFNNVLGVETPQVCNEILGFGKNFCALLAVTDQDIDLFVKKIHSSKSARPPNGKILIPLKVPLSFKLVLLQLKDWQICVELPNGLVIQESNIMQLNIMCKSRKESPKMTAHRKYR